MNGSRLGVGRIRLERLTWSRNVAPDSPLWWCGAWPFAVRLKERYHVEFPKQTDCKPDHQTKWVGLYLSELLSRNGRPGSVSEIDDVLVNEHVWRWTSKGIAKFPIAKEENSVRGLPFMLNGELTYGVVALIDISVTGDFGVHCGQKQILRKSTKG